MNLTLLRKKTKFIVARVCYLGLFCLLVSFPVFEPLSNPSMDLGQALQKSYYYERIGDLNKAIQSLEQIPTRQRNGYTIQVREAYLWLLLGQLANAEFHYQSALKSAPDAITPVLGLMRVYNLQLRYEKTEALAYRILKSDLHNYYANIYLSYALRMQEKYDLAEQVSQKMLSLYPDDVSFLVELAWIFKGKKSFAESAAVVDQIFVLEPENAVAKELHYSLLQNSAHVSQGE